MEFDTKTPQYQNDDSNSFAWTSARERWPVIITQAIDDVHRAVVDLKDPEAQAEGKEIVAEIAKIKYELQHNRKMIPLLDDGEADIKGYNDELEQRGYPTWHSSTWLFSECYLYRRMYTHFSLSQHWKQYDFFARSKNSGLKSSRPAVAELAAQYQFVVEQLQNSSTLGNAKTEAELRKAEEQVFIEMSEICLWGNKTDLSLMPNMSGDDFSRLQGAKARKAAEDKILVNDLSAAFSVLYQAQKSGKEERRVDIVLDNAGFELFVDLILAGYLLTTGLATSIILRPKSIPWFVSDVMPHDFAHLLTAIQNPSYFATEDKPLTDEENSHIEFLFEHWSSLYAEGKLIMRPDLFWTEGGSFWRLPKTAPALYDDLKDSELIIFKGDLNYRKLVADAKWEASTPFEEAIGPLSKGSGLRILALRTCKADTVAGLPKGRDEDIRRASGQDDAARKWAWSGDWAVCQFYDGKI